MACPLPRRVPPRGKPSQTGNACHWESKSQQAEYLGPPVITQLNERSSFLDKSPRLHSLFAAARRPAANQARSRGKAHETPFLQAQIQSIRHQSSVSLCKNRHNSAAALREKFGSGKMP